MKYLLIPLFVVGGIMVVFMALLTFIPVPFMLFVGPMAAGILSVMGWIYMVSGVVFSIPYFVKARKEKANGIGITILGSICQFFFAFDVFAIMIMSIKEGRFRKLTIALICIVVGVIILAIGSILFQVLMA